MIVGSSDEAFTANEIPYLAKAFADVHVFAMNDRHGAPMSVTYPENVHVYQVNVVSGILRIPFYAIKGLTGRCKVLPIGFDSPMRMLTRLYARGRSSSVEQFIVRALLRHYGRFDDLSGAVYSYWFTDQAIAAWRVAGVMNGRGGRFKAFSRAHGYDLYWERNAAGYLPYQDVSLSRLEGVYPCSSFGVRYLSDKYSALSKKIHVARLGTHDFGVGPVAEAQNVFVTCCNFVGLKRMPLFAEAFCKIWSADPTSHWYCVGNGPDMPKVREIVQARHAEAGVTYLGKVANADLMRFYSKTPASFFVNVSTTEGVPVSVMEALSFGIPCIATDVGGSGELVSDCCGKLLKPDLSVDDLSAALSRAVSADKNGYAMMRTNARRVWEELASADVNFIKWCEILKS